MTIREVAKIITKHPRFEKTSKPVKFEHILSKKIAERRSKND